jgi:hypothetical protein
MGGFGSSKKRAQPLHMDITNPKKANTTIEDKPGTFADFKASLEENQRLQETLMRLEEKHQAQLQYMQQMEQEY